MIKQIVLNAPGVNPANCVNKETPPSRSFVCPSSRGINFLISRSQIAASSPVLAISSEEISESKGTILKTVGYTLITTVHGASGPLYGALFMQMGTVTAAKDELTLADWTEAIEAGLNGVVLRGKAARGDKTMVDALIPSAEALRRASATYLPLSEALRACARAAEAGMRDTIPLVARKGMASSLGELSRGHQDPGATSSNLLFQTAAYTWM